MPSICSISGCKNTYVSSGDPYNLISFHRIPKHPEKRFLWEQQVKALIDDYEKKKMVVVCSEHFTEDSFYYMHGRKMLKSSAIPEIFKTKENLENVRFECGKDNGVHVNIGQQTNTPGETNFMDGMTFSNEFQNSEKFVNHNDYTIKLFIKTDYCLLQPWHS
ncbi:hypothetical protein HELRODRAFT_159958 [Helobdella robusta]|uniref:THAP-type domain-containing protein n=1 Tax=Helobdella robusta TaxID=6412 RepID=T1EPL6_HELRO|nr:hypothetical protein HELRODRAFT_159958 [Helobdella robusta]ESO05878.1 hypothetical protein HELRODRAFT_159958 [Helobdella robusta]